MVAKSITVDITKVSTQISERVRKIAMDLGRVPRESKTFAEMTGAVIDERTGKYQAKMRATAQKSYGLGLYTLQADAYRAVDEGYSKLSSICDRVGTKRKSPNYTSEEEHIAMRNMEMEERGLEVDIVQSMAQILAKTSEILAAYEQEKELLSGTSSSAVWSSEDDYILLKRCSKLICKKGYGIDWPNIVDCDALKGKGLALCKERYAELTLSSRMNLLCSGATFVCRKMERRWATSCWRRRCRISPPAKINMQC